MALTLRLSARELVVRGHIPEMLQAIFEQVVLDWEADECHTPHDLWKSLRSLTAVCRAWKDLGCSCPRLWRNLYSDSIDADDDTFRLWPAAEEWSGYRTPWYYYSWTVCLQRAGSVPLHIHAAGALTLLSMAKQLNASQLANVDQLRLEMPDDERLDDIDMDQKATIRQHLLNLKLPNLKTLNMDIGLSFRVQYFKSFISQHYSIRSLILTAVSFLDASLRHTELVDNPVLFPNLEELQIVWSYLDDLDAILCIVSAPHLRCLRVLPTHINGRHLTDGVNVPSSGEKWGRWDSLQLLCVGGEITLAELQSLLLLAPNVQVLELRDTQRFLHEGFETIEGGSLINMLLVREGEPVYLPFLRTLRMDDWMTQTKYILPIDELISSRLLSDSVTPLVEIGLKPHPVWDEWLTRADEFAGQVRLVQWHPKDYWGMPWNL